VKKIITLFLALSLSACTSWQENIFEWGVGVERSMSNLSQHTVTTASHNWTYLDSLPALQEEQSEKGDAKIQIDELETVIMLHGFAVDKNNWIRFARDFEGYRVIAPDLPGHGETSYNEELTYSFLNQTIWLDEFVNKLGLKKFHLVSNSMGGGIAAFYTQQHQDSVLSLTLMNAAGVHSPEPSALQKILESGGENPLIVRSEADFDRLRAFGMEDPIFLPWPAPPVLARRSMARQPINDKIFADITKYSEKVKITKENLTILGKIKTPTLIIWGKQDRAIDVSSVAVFEKYLQDSRSIIMDGVGHGPMIERPYESAGFVLDFIQDVKPAAIHVVSE